MKTKALGSFFVLFAIVAGTVAVAPSAFADHPTANVSVPAGTSSPGCEETNECYIPYEVTVDLGGEVTWSNDDSAAHTVTSGTASDGPDGIFDSGLFMAGATYSVTLEDAGEYPYFCMVHPWMVGTITVAGEMDGHGDGHGDDHGDGGATADEIMVSIETGDAGEGERMDVTVTFTDLDGNSVQHVNYDVMATIGTEVVLEDTGVHDHDGTMEHQTAPLPVAPSEAMPVTFEVTFNGFGVEEPFTGPIGQVATKQVVPEFGTIAMMILGVAIVSIIALSAKSRVIPKL